MKLARLTLDTYGAFTDLTVRFGPGLTVVHGPNEAGKSTLTHAVGDVLWGLVPRQHRYAFEVAPSRLQVTADLDGATGRHTLTVSGRGYRDGGGEPVEPWWSDGAVTSRRAWETGYGIDRDALRDGGRAVLHDGGDLADLLFQARTGVDLAAARDRLVAQAEGLWRRHRGARTVVLRTAKQHVDDLGAQLADAVNAADAVAALAEQLRRAEADLNEARAAHARKAAAKDAAQRDVRAHGAAVALAAIRRDIDEGRAAGDVLTATDLARHDEVGTELTAAQRTVRELGADLADLDATPLPEPDPDALAVADLVDELRRGEDAETDRRNRLQQLHGQAHGIVRDLRDAAAALDPALALADDARLRQGAPALLLPADTADLLARLADRIDDAQGAVDEADRQVRAAETELVTVAPTGPRTAHGRWQAARQVRDRVWQQVREPWLSGQLPEPGLRATLAADLDGSLAATDVAAGDAAVEAEQHVEVQVRAQERQHRLDTARHHHATLVEAHAGLVEQWRRAVGSCGLPEALDVPAWRVRCRAAQRLSGLLADLAAADATTTELADATAAFCERVAGAVTGMGIDLADPLAALTAAHRRVTAARQARTAIAERERQRAALTAKQAKAETRQQQAAHELAGLTARAPDGDLAALVERSRRLLDLQRQQHAVLDQLRAAAPEDDPDRLVVRLADRSVEQVAQAAGQADDEAGDALGQLEQAQERRTDLAGELRTAHEDRNAAVLHQQQVDALDEMAGHARRWARLQLMAGLLRRVLGAEGPHADATLLQHAGSLAGALTGGRVRGLSTADAAGGSRRLVVQLADGHDADAADLSEGTADQVFLALRLAGIRQRQDAARADGAETLPVVLDDVLMAHDDVRTEAALGLLVDEARDQQIIVLTHHRAVADAATAAGATVVYLDPLADPDVAQPEARAEQAPVTAHVSPTQERARAPEQGSAVGEQRPIPAGVVAPERDQGR